MPSRTISPLTALAPPSRAVRIGCCIEVYASGASAAVSPGWTRPLSSAAINEEAEHPTCSAGWFAASPPCALDCTFLPPVAGPHGSLGRKCHNYNRRVVPNGLHVNRCLQTVAAFCGRLIPTVRPRGGHRSHGWRRTLALWLTLSLGLLVVLSGCGGSGLTPDENLDVAQAQVAISLTILHGGESRQAVDDLIRICRAKPDAKYDGINGEVTMRQLLEDEAARLARYRGALSDRLARAAETGCE